jgi:acyl carrier protein
MTAKHEIENEIIKLVQEITKEDSVNIESTVENCGAWDSLAYVSIVSAVEAKFGVEVNSNNINDFGSVRRIISLVQ